MGTHESKSGTFEKVGERLYRYKSNGTYYALFESRGKEIRRSLGTADRALAKRKLGDLQRDIARVDLAAGKCSLAEMCDRYLKTVQNQKPKTVRRKTDIAARLKREFPGGANLAITKVVPSRIAAWLASYEFGAASYNLYLEFIRAVFALAMDDRLLADTPVAHLKPKRLVRPIRETPSFEDFRAILVDIRAQRFNADAKNSGDFVAFIGLAGLGQAEAGSLRWADVDWTNRQITTFRHKTSRGFIVPLYPQLQPLLERLRQDTLNPTDALRWLRVYNATCQPPWPTRRLIHKIAESTRFAHNKPRGYLLGAALKSRGPRGRDFFKNCVLVRLKPKDGRFRTLRTVIPDPTDNACACTFTIFEGQKEASIASVLKVVSIETTPLAEMLVDWPPLVTVPGCKVGRPPEIEVDDKPWWAVETSGLAEEPMVQMALWMFGPGCKVIETGGVVA